MKLSTIALTLGMGAAVVSAGPYDSLEGAGTTNPSKFLWKTLDQFATQIRGGANVGYRAVGSSTGQKEFTGLEPTFTPLNDFGAGDIPMTTERYDQIVGAGRTVAHIPFVMGAIAVFYNGDDGAIPNDIQLDVCTLAKIFSGQITTWNDQEILDLNPGLTLPNLPITVVHRTLGSSSTAGFTEYIEKATTEDDCAASWGGQGSGSTIDWFVGSIAAQGSGGVTDEIKSRPGAIGYLDAGHGYSENLDEVALRNEDGNYLLVTDSEISAAGAVAVDSGIIPSDATESFADVNLYNLAGPDTWPITMISYIYVDMDASALGARAPTYLENLPLLVALLEYVNSDEGQEVASDDIFGFTPIPPEIRALNDETIATLKANNANQTAEWMVFETSTMQYTGAADNVISSKRQSWTQILADDNADAIGEIGEDDPSLVEDVVSLSARISALEGDGNSNVTDLESRVAMLETLEARVVDLEADEHTDEEYNDLLSRVTALEEKLSDLETTGANADPGNALPPLVGYAGAALMGFAGAVWATTGARAD